MSSSNLAEVTVPSTIFAVETEPSVGVAVPPTPPSITIKHVSPLAGADANIIVEPPVPSVYAVRGS